MQRTIPCTIMRGGTSKGVYLLEKDLPPEGEARDSLLLRLMGSPDLKQIDGLGGAASVTSKVAILAPSAREGIDVDYTFAQVSIDKPVVSYAGNCGNISSGVGPFAIESGLVKTDSDNTTVHIFNTNTKKLMVENVQTPGGKVEYAGDFSIPGVPGTAAPVKVMVVDPAGTIGKGLLPTGKPVDVLDIPGFGKIEATIVDSANPLVFVRAKDVGLTGIELPTEIDADADKLELLESIRGEAARMLGLVEDAKDSAWKTPGVPKMTIVAPPNAYVTSGGEEIAENKVDILGRMMSMQKAHPTYAMTGAMCTASAAVVPGTIVYEAKRDSAEPTRLRIGQPGGVLDAGVDHTENGGEVAIQNAYGFRTARLIMQGTAYC